MRKNTGLLLSVLTAMVLGIGLFLPRIASSLQNRHTAALVQQYPVKTIQLETITPADVIQRLSLVSGEHISIGLETGGVRSGEEAHQLALEALALIEDTVMDLDLERYTGHQQTPTLVLTEDGENAAVLWRCELIDTSGGSSIVLHLDDDTGKMISFVYVSDLIVQPNVSPIDQTAEKWANMCAEYYGFEWAETELYTSSESAQHHNLTFIADDGNGLILPFRIAYVSGTTISVMAAENKEVDRIGYVRRVLSFN